MKKIALFSLIACLGFVGDGMAKCPSDPGVSLKTVKLARGSTQQAYDDEFLYTNGKEYQKMKDNGAINSFNYNNKNKDTELSNDLLVRNGHKVDGYVLECDNQVCSNGTVAVLPSSGWGWNGTSNGKAGQAFLCDARSGSEDKWIKVTIQDCASDVFLTKADGVYEATNASVKLVEDADKYYYNIGNGIVCKCDNYNATTRKCDSVGGASVQGCPECEKKAAEIKTCEQQYPNNQAAINCCKAGQNWKNNKCECKDKAKEWDGKKCVKKAGTSCEETYKGNDEAIACCNTGATWIAAEKRCDCNTGNWVYDKDTKTGQCVVNSGNGELTQCMYTFNIDIQCKNSDRRYTKGEQYPLTKEQAEKIGCGMASAATNQFTGLKSLTDIAKMTESEIVSFDNLIKVLCGDNGGSLVVNNNNQPTGPDSARVNDALNKINAFKSSAESGANVWKDAEGKFNTARLASDLTAGVVLGTVGGVVSGVVIKKKQVEKGFEALHCAVGGQTVADWGDEFTVGLR